MSLITCLQDLPINVFTDDEKTSIIVKLLKIANDYHRRTQEKKALGSEPVIGLPNADNFEPLTPEDKRLEKAGRDLRTSLKFMHDELNIIAKRAKNYMRRQEV